MTIYAYLAFNERKVTKATTRRPDIAQDERMIRVQLEVPRELFNPPVPTAVIQIDSDAVQMPPPQQVEVPAPHPDITDEEEQPGS